MSSLCDVIKHLYSLTLGFANKKSSVERYCLWRFSELERAAPLLCTAALFIACADFSINGRNGAKRDLPLFLIVTVFAFFWQRKKHHERGKKAVENHTKESSKTMTKIVSDVN